MAVPVALAVLLGLAANAAMLAATQRMTPEAMRGRVNGAMYQAAMSLAALAPLTAGLLVQHLSGQWAVAAFTAASGVAALVCAVLPGLEDASHRDAPQRHG